MTTVDKSEFQRTGYATKLRAVPADEMRASFDKYLALVERPSRLFDKADVDKQRHMRNRHLDSALALDLATHPAVLDAISAVLGPDLVLWRTEFFVQGKTDPETRWHQDRQFSGPRRLPSLVLADNGDAIVSLDHRGAITKFAAARITTDGTVVWAKTWDGGNDGDRNNTYVVRRNGGTVYVGGRIAVQAADTTHGDGFLLGLDAATGAYKLGAIYYSGKSSETMVPSGP